MSPNEGGDVEINEEAPLFYPATYTWPSSTLVSVDALAAPGYEFANWSGDLTGSTNSASLLIDCGKGVTAHFLSQDDTESTGSIGGFVWDDTDGDGIHDTHESGISDVGVILRDANKNLVNSTSTLAGIYRFDDLEPEEYYIFFNVPSPYLFSPMDEGEDDEVDSDADATGRTDDVLLTEGEDLTLDAGVSQHDSDHVEITAREAKDLIDSNPQLIVVDVREESKFCGEGGHIPGARNLPWNSGVFEQRFDELPVDGVILLVCRSSHRTTHAAEFLDSKGYTSVYNMDDGMSAWEWETVGCEIHSGGGNGGDVSSLPLPTGFVPHRPSCS